MILVLSSSQAIASAALFTEDGVLVAEASQEAPRSAGSALLSIASEWIDTSPLTAVVADLGPGSFTGVKVAVTMAKMLAFAKGIRAGGVSAFDLACPGEACSLPARKGWVFAGGGGASPILMAADATPAPDQLPSAGRFRLADAVWTDPVALLPLYAAEPNISVAKRPVIMGEHS